MNSVGYFDIHTTKPKESIAFYKAVFGWKFIKVKMIPSDLDEYYRIETNGISGGLVVRSAPVAPPKSRPNAFVCSMQADDFDKTAKKILRNGGRVVVPKIAVPGRCWQGYFMAPDKNVFGVFEVDENAG